MTTGAAMAKSKFLAQALVHGLLDPLHAGLGQDAIWRPLIDVVASHDFARVRLELAGVSIEELEISVSANVLRVSGRRPSDPQSLSHKMRAARFKSSPPVPSRASNQSRTRPRVGTSARDCLPLSRSLRDAFAPRGRADEDGAWLDRVVRPYRRARCGVNASFLAVHHEDLTFDG